MGICQSASEEDERAKKIDDKIKADKGKARSEVKLLLLGTGESGKSTIFKQMKIIHRHGFESGERHNFIPTIRKHALENYNDVVRCALVGGLLSSKEERAIVDLLDKLSTDGPTETIISRLHDFWTLPRSDPEENTTNNNNDGNNSSETNSNGGGGGGEGGRGLVRNSSSFAKGNYSSLRIACREAKKGRMQIADSAEYFLDHLPRVMCNDFTPTDEDILMCRVRTTGVAEMDLLIEGTKFRLVDVGGQRNERRKWIHCFEDVQGVIFVTAISEYDQVLFEDEKTNRLHESLKLFSEISNTQFFADAALILFLNKKDLFEEKIKTVDLTVCFPEYTEGHSYDHALEFIKQKFISKTKHEMYLHVTCATSTGNVRFVFDSVRESMLMQHVNSSGMV